MTKVLVIHGAGMNMRGKVQVDIFGPMTLAEYDERIRGYAKELGIEVEIFHSNIEGEIVNRLYAANDEGFAAMIFNPAAFGTGYPALVAAISQVKFPTVEVHISNPIRRGPARFHSSTNGPWRLSRAIRRRNSPSRPFSAGRAATPRRSRITAPRSLCGRTMPRRTSTSVLPSARRHVSTKPHTTSPRPYGCGLTMRMRI